MFDWMEFLRTRHIEFVTSGPNVAHGNINVKCPMCGDRDPSQHMGIALNGSGWSCWRNPQHRGRSPVYLVALLARISVVEAREIVGYGRAIPGDVASMVQAMLVKSRTSDPVEPLTLPKEFKEFRDVPRARMYVNYLVERGYERSHIFGFTEAYGLRYSNLGPFKGRIVFPVYVEGELVSWTARTVYKGDVVRYKTLTTSPEKARSQGLSPGRGAVNDFLLWYDDLMMTTGKVLILVEGPFDALRVRYLGESEGVMSTCFFTSAPTTRQIGWLRDLVERYDRRCLVLDRGMLSNLLHSSDLMSSLGVKHCQVPERFDDPGELSRRGFRQLMSTILSM